MRDGLPRLVLADAWRRDPEAPVVVGDRVDTIADGIAVRVPIPEAVTDLDGVVDEVVLVDDDALLGAMRLCHAHAGLVVEPAGAAGLAAVVEGRARFAGQHVATVLCGGNTTAENLVEVSVAPCGVMLTAAQWRF